MAFSAVLTRLKDRFLSQRETPIPADLVKNQCHLSPEAREALRSSIETHYHTGWRSRESYTPEAYERDLHAHLEGRLRADRRLVIPWISAARRLQGQRVLEIGCGTGSSTVALAEQGATVTGLDIDTGALQVARDRCAAYGLKVDFREGSADRLADTFSGQTFDLVIFFASLEHMTIAERLASLAQAWGLLVSGGLLVIVETPNRLWHFDGHTALLPFYHWLPNELAFKYAHFSERENFRELYTNYDAESKEHFLRRGRGMSYHELELAIAPVRQLKVVSSLSTYQGRFHDAQQKPLDRKYKALLQSLYPALHPGFFDEMLYLILGKE